MRSTMMYAAFKMCKGIATKYQFEPMYDFIQEGFAAMKPMKSAATFIKTFTAKEREIIEKSIQGIQILSAVKCWTIPIPLPRGIFSSSHKN